MIVNLVRTETSPQGTFGMLILKDTVFYTAELPWKNNERSKSCVPYGEYSCHIVDSPKFGKRYEVKSVEGRSHILIHPGNWAGDVDAGFKTDSDGCILLGLNKSVINNQKAVASSRAALSKFENMTSGAPFNLIISGLDIW